MVGDAHPTSDEIYVGWALPTDGFRSRRSPERQIDRGDIPTPPTTVHESSHSGGPAAYVDQSRQVTPLSVPEIESAVSAVQNCSPFAIQRATDHDGTWYAKRN
jgi:hypothetical protein